MLAVVCKKTGKAILLCACKECADYAQCGWERKENGERKTQTAVPNKIVEIIKEEVQNEA